MHLFIEEERMHLPTMLGLKWGDLVTLHCEFCGKKDVVSR